MDQENKSNKKYSWELLDTSTLMLPEELITYHLYRYEKALNSKRNNDVNKENQILSGYLQEDKKKEVEVETCFQK